MSYTLETILAEKIETILARGIDNTRPRDYYDIYVLERLKLTDVKPTVLKAALDSTTKKRGSEYVLTEYDKII